MTGPKQKQIESLEEQLQVKEQETAATHAYVETLQETLFEVLWENHDLRKQILALRRELEIDA